MTVVSNASPLITLSKVGALHVLPELFGKLIVATEVFHEVTVIGPGVQARVMSKVHGGLR